MSFRIAVAAFVKESNLIEGIKRPPTKTEIEESVKFLKLPVPTVGTLSEFVFKTTGRSLRSKSGEAWNVWVGKWHPPKGGPHIVDELNDIVKAAFENSDTPFNVHRRFQTLHPFMDGNGRSGRLLWAWHMLEHDIRPGLVNKFLHQWYYQSLDALRAQFNRDMFIFELPQLLEEHSGKWVVYHKGKRAKQCFNSDIEAHHYCDEEDEAARQQAAKEEFIGPTDLSDRYIRKVQKQARPTIGFHI